MLCSAMLAQMAVESGRVADAVATVRACSSLAHQPSVVATLTAVLNEAGDTETALGVFEEAAAHWDAVATGAEGKARSRAFAVRAAILRLGSEFMIKHVRVALWNPKLG